MSEQLVELAYSKFVNHYSKRNWFSNEPNWVQLSERDRKFWNEFVVGIKFNFKGEPIQSEKLSSESAK